MKTNSLIYRATRHTEKETFEIKIRLNDECKNGHQDFSITGTIYEKGKPKTDRYMISCGAIGDKIAANFPEFEIFERLHLSDCKGRLMYAVENGRYHFTNTSFETGRDYLRLTDSEAVELNKYSGNKEAFRYYLEKMGIVQRWEKEADEAIKFLEKLTGDEFINDSKRYQYTPLSEEEKSTFEQREKEGFFSLEKIAERKQAAINGKNEIIAAEEMAKVKKMQEFADAKEKAIKAILAAGLPLQNCIFYDHSQSCRFNWKKWEEIKVSESDFLTFVENNKIDGFTFEIEK